jgi:hypothetical protein
MFRIFPTLFLAALSGGAIGLSMGDECLEMRPAAGSHQWRYFEERTTWCGSMGCEPAMTVRTQVTSENGAYRILDTTIHYIGNPGNRNTDTTVVRQETPMAEGSRFSMRCFRIAGAFEYKGDSIFFSNEALYNGTPMEIFSRKLGLLNWDSNTFFSSHGNGMWAGINLKEFDGDSSEIPVILQKIRELRRSLSITPIASRGHGRLTRFGNVLLQDHSAYNALGVSVRVPPGPQTGK